MTEDFEKKVKTLEYDKKVLEAKNRALTSEYRALRDACPKEILEKLQVDYSKESLTEEQQNCPYCHSHDIHGTKEFKCNYDKACAWIELDDKVITFDNADGGRTFGEFEINYCPICGRKLEE